MEFGVSKVRIYGLDESMVASGYPKSVNVDIRTDIEETCFAEEKDLIRAKKLGHAPGNSGHDCFLKGIIMQCDLTASHAFWIQWMRHHFQDIVSSQSKMHRIMEMDIAFQCNEYVDESVLNVCDILKKVYIKNKTKENFYRLIYSLPLGLMLTARITDNYLSLKTQYHQRKNEKLYEWVEYCKIIEELPMFRELVLNASV